MASTFKTCRECEVGWTGDSPCWVCGREPEEGGAQLTVTVGARSWRSEDGDQVDLDLAARRRALRFGIFGPEALDRLVTA